MQLAIVWHTITKLKYPVLSHCLSIYFKYIFFDFLNTTIHWVILSLDSVYDVQTSCD